MNSKGLGAIVAFEKIAIEGLLAEYGYPKRAASKLIRAGLTPRDVAALVKQPPISVGGLEYKYGVKKRAK